MEDGDIPMLAPTSQPAKHQNTSEQLPKSRTVTPKDQQKFDRYWNILQQKLVNRKQSQKRIETYKELLAQSLTDERLNRALGAVYGAFIGDALGAYCQFHQKLDDKTVDEALEMNGGGTFSLQAGQFTDDSELATHLLNGLSKIYLQKPLKKQTHRLICNIGLQYTDWRQSGPFDIGNTCRLGISSLGDFGHLDKLDEYADNCEQEPPFFQRMFSQIYQRTGNSLANGSLMRISPFALFFSSIDQNPLEYQQFIKDEIRLTHSHPLLGQAGLFWVNTLTSLIKRKSDKRSEFQQILNLQKDERFKNIKSWFSQASQSKEESMPANANMGYAKIAFSYGLKILHYIISGQQKKLDQTLFVNWMRWIIKRAGDTDTNAAIAGGLLGSVIGFWNLPQKYVVRSLKTITDGRKLEIEDKQVQPQLTTKNKYQNPRRPTFYEPANGFLLALEVMWKCRFISKNKPQ